MSGCDRDRILEVHGSMWRLQCLETCTHQYWDDVSVPLCNLDKETMRAISQGDLSALMNNPKIKTLMENSTVKKLTRDARF